MGENAIGIVGNGYNIKDVTLKDIDYVKKESENLALKGEIFDLSPSKIKVDVPRNCGMYIHGAPEVVIENVNLHQWKAIVD